MRSRNMIFVLIALVLLVLFGCSGGSREPIQLSNPENQPVSDESGRQFWGAWTANFDLESKTVDVVPDRELNWHFNVTPFIPKPGIVIVSWDPVYEVITVKVTLNNNTSLDGYDVRLIIYRDTVGHQLENCDDWTPLFDIPGGDTINPFMAYAKTEVNRKFAAHTSHTETLEIYLPGFNPNVRFAVDASYPRNCLEPYTIDNFQQGVLYETLGASTNVSVDVYDWQNDITEVFLVCDLILGPESLLLTPSGGNTFSGVLYNNMGAPSNYYLGWIMAFSSGAPNLPLWDWITIYVSPGGGDIHVHVIDGIEKPGKDGWYDIGVEPMSYVYVCADHPATENVNGTRTAISFKNDLSGMTVINPGTGMNDPESLGMPQFWNRIDVTDKGFVVTNPGIQTMFTWEVMGNVATITYPGNALSCGGYWEGNLGFPDVWNHNDNGTYGSLALGYTETIDCAEPQYSGTIKRPDGGTTGVFGGIYTGRFYEWQSIKAAQGLDYTEDSVYFISSEQMGYLSISGSWVNEQFDLVTVKNETGKLGTGDGEFFGGLDCAVDSKNNILTLENHGGGVYRFQKFDSNLVWLWSSIWDKNNSPMRMDFDREDNQLYLLCSDGIYICDVD